MMELKEAKIRVEQEKWKESKKKKAVTERHGSTASNYMTILKQVNN